MVCAVSTTKPPRSGPAAVWASRRLRNPRIAGLRQEAERDRYDATSGSGGKCPLALVADRIPYDPTTTTTSNDNCST